MSDKKNLYMRKKTFEGIVRFINDGNLSEKYPAFIPVVTQLNKRLDKVRSLLSVCKPGRSSEVKKAYRKNLSEAAHCVSSAVYAFAQITGNASLKNAVHYTYSDFYRPEESTMMGRCRQVLNAARKIKNPEHYGLMPFIIEKLEGEMKKYSDFQDTPVARVQEHARSMRQADKLLNQCLSIIKNQLDPLIVVVNCSEKFLLSDYATWRKIDKCPGRKRKYIRKQKPELPVSENNLPLPEKITAKPASKIPELSV